VILIDSREFNGPYIQTQFTKHNIESEITCLETNTGSDYFISNLKGSCAIQRKVVVSEMISELDQIMHQIIPALKNFSENPVLLLEENFSISPDGYLHNRADGRPTDMLATSYYGYLETVRKLGVDVQCTRDLNQSVWWMIAMHGYLAKEHYPKHRKYFSVQEQSIGMLTAVTGIGEARAMKALEHGSIRSMCGCRNVPGLTGKMSERLQEILRWKL